MGVWEVKMKRPTPALPSVAALPHIAPYSRFAQKGREKERRNNARCVAPLLLEGSGEALEAMPLNGWSNAYEQPEQCSGQRGAMLQTSGMYVLLLLKHCYSKVNN